MGGILSKGFHSHNSVLVGDELWIWGGYQPDLPLVHDIPKKKRFTSLVTVLKIFDSTLVQKQLTTGTPPNGIINYSSCCDGTDIYYFGGSCMLNDCYHNDLFVLDTGKKKWKKIVCGTYPGVAMPTKKADCGMISFTEESYKYLLVIGGYGHALLDEIHILCVSESALDRECHKWNKPQISGDDFQLASHFSINALPGNKAILFGGQKRHGSNTFACSNITIRLSYTKNKVYFEKISATGPRARFNHSSAVISSVSDGVKKYYLLVLGGEDMRHRVMADCWILDIEEKTWTELSLQMVDTSVAKRSDHSISHLKISENRVWLIITGGKSSRNQMILSPYNIVIAELVHTDGKWITGDVILPEKAQGSAYTEYLLHSLSEAREEQEKTSIERDEHLSIQLEEKDEIISWKDVEIKELNRTMQQKDIELGMSNEKIMQKEKEINEHKEVIREKVIAIQEERERNTLEKEAIIGEKHKLQEENQEKQRVIEMKEAEIEGKQREIQIMQVRIDNLLRNRRLNQTDITLTDTELGNGAYGEVRLGKFHGTKVAVKCLHTAIASGHNVKLFQQEMETCESIFHPNIVQYIGSTFTNGPILVFELMAENLSDHIKKAIDKESKYQLPHPQIITIASHICSAMCYLHQRKPHPIIHKDIGSPNVLMEPLPNNEWKAKLSDFGSVEISSIAPGNRFYSAPEALISGGNHSPAMDVYSFGIVLTDMALCRSLSMKDTLEHDESARAIDWGEMRVIVLKCINDVPDQRLSSTNLLTELNQL